MVDNNLSVIMRWSSSNKKKYVDRGYIFTKMGDEFFVKIKDVIECSSGAKIPVTCDYCGNTYYPTVRNYTKAHIKKDKDCCVSCKGMEIKETVNKKYGVDNVMHIPEIVEKQNKTCLQRFGTMTPLHNQEIFLKTQESFNRHYKTVNGIKDLRSVPEINCKIEETNCLRYGGKSPFCSTHVRKKGCESLYNNGKCPSSKKQRELYKILVDKYGKCELNYLYDKLFLDCYLCIDNQKIDIEYDGWYWHRNRKEEDKRRDYFLFSQGFKILRILAYKNILPEECQIFDCINILLTTNKRFLKIELQ